MVGQGASRRVPNFQRIHFVLLVCVFQGVPGMFYGLLVIFVEPPTKWWAGGDVLSGDWRPTLLSLGLLILFLIFLATPAIREFYGLTLLRQPDHSSQWCRGS